MDNKIVENMTNLGESGQDTFVRDWAYFAKLSLYEKGISKKFLNSEEASYFIAKFVTDTIDDGNLSSMMEELIATLRVNHPHSEDIEDV